jgi:manganese efflux pump family protein
MAVAALAAWLVAAGAGFVMLGVLVRGGAYRPETRSQLSAVPVFGHLTMAVIGLLVWIGYVGGGQPTLAWMAFVALLPVIGLGIVMVARWVKARRRAGVPEARLRVGVVVVHGLAGITTIVLVLLAAVRAGQQ